MALGLALAALTAFPFPDASALTGPPIDLSPVSGLVKPGSPPPSAAPSCVFDERAPHVLLVYARPFDEPDGFASAVPRLRLSLEHAGGYVAREAEALGWRYAVRALCESDETPVVREAVLATSTFADSFASIEADLLASGVAGPGAKLLVLYEGDVDGLGGEARRYPDDRPSPENLNDQPGSVAVVYGNRDVPDGWIFLHELAHTLGAVQSSAPHATGAGHCNDGADVVCKPDEGNASAYESRCGAPRRFDCGHDDYFHPDPPPQSYLATHWNVARSRYLDASPLR